MEGTVKLIVAEKFNSGKIDAYKVALAKGGTPPLIKSLVPAHGGDGNIRYRWAVNGRLIEGANSETYQPPAVSYSATYTRMAHDETCNIPWTSSAGEAVVTMEQQRLAPAFLCAGSLYKQCFSFFFPSSLSFIEG